MDREKMIDELLLLIVPQILKEALADKDMPVEIKAEAVACVSHNVVEAIMAERTRRFYERAN